MVTMYVQGKPYASVPEMDWFFEEMIKMNMVTEFRDDQGNSLGKFVPTVQYPVPWDPSVTKEQLDREHAAGGGITIEEFWKKIGAK